MEVAIITGPAGNRMNYSYTENNRIGDHIWWISVVTMRLPCIQVLKPLKLPLK